MEVDARFPHDKSKVVKKYGKTIITRINLL